MEISREEYEELVEVLEDMVNQHCRCEEWKGYNLDSGCLSANGDAMILLAKLGRLETRGPIGGRRVIGRFKEKK